MKNIDLHEMKEHDTDSIAMVLLMGGYSTRMGSSKAELPWGGMTFAERIAGELASCGPVYLSVSADTFPSPLWKKYPRIADVIPHTGPMGGLSAVFHQIPHDACFLCACDMPFMSSAYVRHLCGLWQQLQLSENPGTPGIHPDVQEKAKNSTPTDALLVKSSSGRVYTTAGIYHRRLLPEIDTRIQAGNYRLRDLLSSCRTGYITEDSLGTLKKALININTMDEYLSLKGNAIPGE